MLSDDIVKLLNEQIDAESYASRLYLQMAAWCDSKGLDGGLAFFRSHAADELTHRDRIVDYLLECDAPIELGTVDAPPHDFGSFLEVIQKAYDHEKVVTERINNIAATALDTRDFNTWQFIQWFITEQREEENLFRSAIQRAEIAGFTGEKGEPMWLINNYLRTLNPGSASA